MTETSFSTLVGFFGTRLLLPSVVQGFTTVRPNQRHAGSPWGLKSTTGTPTTTPDAIHSSDDNKEQAPLTTEPSSAVRAPLNYVGPYPSLALTFPDLATPNQKTKNATGISLDFILDLQPIQYHQRRSGTRSWLACRGSHYQVSVQLVHQEGKPLLGDLNCRAFRLYLHDGSDSLGATVSPAAAGLLSLAFMQSFTGGGLCVARSYSRRRRSRTRRKFASFNHFSCRLTNRGHLARPDAS
jgi:hypothetical protein